jgi:hypothetical protein
MSNIAVDYIHRSLGGFTRGPVLTVLILLLAAFAVAVFALWLGSVAGQNRRKSELFYVAGIVTTEHTLEGPYAKITVEYRSRRFDGGFAGYW